MHFHSNIDNLGESGLTVRAAVIRLALLHYPTGKLCIAAPARAERQAVPGAEA